MQNYLVTYLLPRIEQANAVEERGLPGQYRHQMVVAALREADIVSDLRQRGAVPLSIAPVKPKKASLWRGAERSNRERLLQAMVFSVQSGMSASRALQRALEGDAGSALNPVRASIWRASSAGSCPGSALTSTMLITRRTAGWNWSAREYVV